MVLSVVDPSWPSRRTTDRDFWLLPSCGRDRGDGFLLWGQGMISGIPAIQAGKEAGGLCIRAARIEFSSGYLNEAT